MISMVPIQHRHTDTLPCPVCGALAHVSVTYRRQGEGRGKLVHFECDREGTCGITDWDPCPLFVLFYRNAANDSDR